ncbi:hypothetical protein ACH5RR_039063, partial [Cinchona calisaya]
MGYSVLDRTKEAGINPDVITYNTLLSCASRSRQPVEAYMDFKDIFLRNITPDPATFNIMITGLCKNKYIDNALMLLRNLQRNGFRPELVTYNILIDGICKSGSFKNRMFDEGLEIFLEMKAQGYTFDGFASCTVAGALLRTGRIKEGNKCMGIMFRSGIDLDM